MYKLSQVNLLTNLQTSVIRTTDGACIPFDPANTDYQEYLKWIEDGGIPLPAENT